MVSRLSFSASKKDPEGAEEKDQLSCFGGDFSTPCNPVAPGKGLFGMGHGRICSFSLLAKAII